MGVESGTPDTQLALLTCDDDMGALKPGVQGHAGLSTYLRFRLVLRRMRERR